MALSLRIPSPFSLFQFQKHSSIQIIPIRIFPRKSSFPISISNQSFTKIRTSLPSICCSSSLESSPATDNSPSTSVYIKGLSQSTSEGLLKKAFSQFGDVNQVKIIIDKYTGQPFGSAFVSFNQEEFAKLAVSEMNGKFFDGRFIMVKIARPRSSAKWKRVRKYKFNLNNH
ncbi:hypothetical protein UlMin_009388 [Ulmus minor]